MRVRIFYFRLVTYLAQRYLSSESRHEHGMFSACIGVAFADVRLTMRKEV